MDSTTTICHRYTPREQLKHFASTADILVTATGVPNLITADMVKPGACIIDVGITRVKDPSTGKTKLVGDVDYESKCGELQPSAKSPIADIQLIVFLRCEQGRGAHHSSSRRSRANDGDNADEEHRSGLQIQSPEEEGAISVDTRKLVSPNQY